jgi:hypothetical protein
MIILTPNSDLYAPQSRFLLKVYTLAGEALTLLAFQLRHLQARARRRVEMHARQGAKNGIFEPFIYKTNILPRQARDKHRENSKKMPFYV